MTTGYGQDGYGADWFGGDDVSFDGERAAIETRFLTLWGNVSYTDPITKKPVPVFCDGIPSTPPDGAWMTLEILTGGGTQIELGSNAMSRWVGIIQHLIHTPVKGSGQAKQIADLIFPIWARATFSASGSGTIRTKIPSAKRLGVVGSHYVVAVSVEYWRDEQVLVATQ